MDRQQILQMVATVASCRAPLSVLEGEGFPPGYGHAFQLVANQQKAIVSTRTPGRSCMGLLREGYDAKSFHIKGKSCNWGPMAGFVCLDPLLNKRGIEIEQGKTAATGNLEAHQHSLVDAYEGTRTARARHIVISDQRLSWLLSNGYLTGMVTRGQTKEGTAERGGVCIAYRLMPTNIDSGRGWGIFYNRAALYATPYGQQLAQERHFETIRTAMGVQEEDGFAPMLAMTNPHPPYVAASSLYKNAITGDFDLFAIWPHTGRSSQYDSTADERMAGMNHVHNPQDKEIQAMKVHIFKNEHAQLGNISERIFLIAQLLNMTMAAHVPGNVKPNRVFHSDEGGRPGAKALELPTAAFIPGHLDGYLLKTVAQMKSFAMYCHRAGYRIFANVGWIRELGEEITRGSPEISNVRPGMRAKQH